MWVLFLQWASGVGLHIWGPQILARGGVDPNDTLLLAPEATLEDAELLTLASILRLRIERGDLLYSETHYGASCNSPADWPEWVDDVLNTPAYREIVVRLLTLEVVSVCRDLSMPRNNRAIQDIGFAISCWSVDTHTFVGAWGEIWAYAGGCVCSDALHSRGNRLFDPRALSAEERNDMRRIFMRLIHIFGTYPLDWSLRPRGRLCPVPVNSSSY